MISVWILFDFNWKAFDVAFNVRRISRWNTKLPTSVRFSKKTSNSCSVFSRVQGMARHGKSCVVNAYNEYQRIVAVERVLCFTDLSTTNLMIILLRPTKTNNLNVNSLRFSVLKHRKPRDYYYYTNIYYWFRRNRYTVIITRIFYTILCTPNGIEIDPPRDNCSPIAIYVLYTCDIHLLISFVSLRFTGQMQPWETAVQILPSAATSQGPAVDKRT